MERVKMNKTLKFVSSLSYMAVMLLVFSQFATANTGNPGAQIEEGFTQIQTILTGLVVIVGVCAGVWIILKKLPGIDDPHTKNEAFKGVGYVLGGVATAAALVWLIPWVFDVFS